MRINILLYFLLATGVVQAQNTKVKFNSLLQVSLVDGEVGPAMALQTINGIQYKTWSGGVGVGLDYYHTRSIPLFLDVRKNILKSDKTPFVYVDGGYNFAWLTDEDKLYGGIESKGGLYYDAGIGYAVPVLKQSSLFFTAGYSSKKMTSNSVSLPVDIFSSYVPPSYKQEYTLRRISIKLGLRL